jgi:hypothetical protein
MAARRCRKVSFVSSFRRPAALPLVHAALAAPDSAASLRCKSRFVWEILRAGAEWWMARSACAAMMALHLSGVVFRRKWSVPQLQKWEGPFADPSTAIAATSCSGGPKTGEGCASALGRRRSTIQEIRVGNKIKGIREDRVGNFGTVFRQTHRGGAILRARRGGTGIVTPKTVLWVRGPWPLSSWSAYWRLRCSFF